MSQIKMPIGSADEREGGDDALQSLNASERLLPSARLLEDLFTASIADIYGAEKALTKALPEMQSAATTQELQQAIGDHMIETEEHVTRLESVFSLMEKVPGANVCQAMDGLLNAGQSMIATTRSGSVTRDAAVIMAAQKIEHFEIAAYGNLVQLARVMGNDEVADLLAQTLEEEKNADRTLTEISQNNINWESVTKQSDGIFTQDDLDDTDILENVVDEDNETMQEDYLEEGDHNEEDVTGDQEPNNHPV